MPRSPWVLDYSFECYRLLYYLYVTFHFALISLVLKLRILRKVNSITILAKNPTERRQRLTFLCWGVGGKQNVIITGKPTQSDWKPNPHSAPGGIQTEVLEVEGKERYHYTSLTTFYVLGSHRSSPLVIVDCVCSNSMNSSDISLCLLYLGEPYPQLFEFPPRDVQQVGAADYHQRGHTLAVFVSSSGTDGTSRAQFMSLCILN